MSLQLSRHASIRVQQRGIPRWFLNVLVTHGKTKHDGHGAMLKTVDKSTRRRLQLLLTREEYAQAERFFDIYAVVAADDSIITVAHRTRRRFH